jgi:hypothetical protein
MQFILVACIISVSKRMQLECDKYRVSYTMPLQVSEKK